MSESKDVGARDAAWQRVTEQFATLGEELRERFEGPETPAAPEAAPGAAAEDTRESVQDALRTLGDAAERLATTVGSAIRDPQVQATARQAASSLVDALGLTFSQVSEGFRRRGERTGDGDDPWDPPAPQVEVVEEIERRPEE